MKFDPFNWYEVKTNEQVSFGKGRLRLRISAAAPLYVTRHYATEDEDGVVSFDAHEALAGVDTFFDLEVSQAVTVRVEAPKGVRAFAEGRDGTSAPFEGEVYANLDRMVIESGTLAEIRRAGRLQEIQHRQQMAEMRAETAKFLSAKQKAEPAASAPAPAPVVSVAPPDPGAGA